MQTMHKTTTNPTMLMNQHEHASSLSTKPLITLRIDANKRTSAVSRL